MPRPTAMQRKYRSLFSDGNDFTKDPVYIFRPELREKISIGAITEEEYCSLSHEELFRRARKHVDSIAGEYGYIGRLFGKSMAVGVQGDFRTYAFIAEIEGPYEPDIIAQLATRITNEVAGINRVVYRLRT